MLENIIFENLNLHPEFMSELRERYWNEWSESLKKEFNISDFSEYQLDKDIIYFVGIHYEDNVSNDSMELKKIKKLVSSIAITPNDLGEKTDLTPWLSYVYVVPEYRNKGIANKMIQWYLENVEIRPLYLWCKHPLENFYNKFGFEIIENRPDIAIMEKKSKMKIVFENLELHPEFKEELMKIYWTEWSDCLKNEFSISDFSEYQLDKDIMYFVAVEYTIDESNEKKKLVGSIGLTPTDLDKNIQYKNWLSYVYILPEYRNQGIGNKMIKWFLENITIRPLYLWCTDSLTNFYNKFGFETIEIREDIVIMEKL